MNQSEVLGNLPDCKPVVPRDVPLNISQLAEVPNAGVVMPEKVAGGVLKFNPPKVNGNPPDCKPVVPRVPLNMSPLVEAPNAGVVMLEKVVAMVRQMRCT